MIQDVIISALGALGGTAGFCYLLHSPSRTILPASVTGMIGFVIYVLLYRYVGHGTMLSYFAATMVVTVICEILARVMRLPSTIFLLTSLVPLVPGYNFYSAMLALVEDNSAAFAAYIMEAVQIVAVIAIGAAVTSVLFRTLAGLKNQKGHK